MPRCLEKNSLDYHLYNSFDYIIPYICKLGIHPNIITLLSYPLAYFFYMDMRYNHKPIRALMWLLFYAMLDCLDGEVARQCDKKSTLGSYLDSLGGFIHISAIIMLFIILVLKIKIKNELTTYFILLVLSTLIALVATKDKVNHTFSDNILGRICRILETNTIITYTICWFILQLYI